MRCSLIKIAAQCAQICCSYFFFNFHLNHVATQRYAILCVNGKRQHAGRSGNWKSKQAKAAVNENVKRDADHTYGAQ